LSNPKQDLIRYRMGRAREALTDADAALREERLNEASNRIYYAMFYAATALLATRDLSSSRHSGVISLLHEQFVHPGTFPRPLAHQLASAFDMRAESDYKDFAEPDPVRLREMLEQAGIFIEAVEKLIPAQEQREARPC
jgi:uncharacterized protein (UPF0332 family)